MRVLGVDLGSRRIGIALSDATGTVASPFTVILRGQDPRADYDAIAEVARAEEVDRIVVGLPLSLSGRMGSAAHAAVAEAEALAGVVAVPVETFDERLTTVSAHRALAEQNVRSRQRRSIVDKVAAAVMLQAWLDSARAPSAGPDEGGA